MCIGSQLVGLVASPALMQDIEMKLRGLRILRRGRPRARMLAPFQGGRPPITKPNGRML